MTLWIGNGAVLKVPVNGKKKNFEKKKKKKKKSWTELFNFQNSFNCH